MTCESHPSGWSVRCVRCGDTWRVTVTAVSSTEKQISLPQGHPCAVRQRTRDHRVTQTRIQTHLQAHMHIGAHTCSTYMQTHADAYLGRTHQHRVARVIVWRGVQPFLCQTAERWLQKACVPTFLRSVRWARGPGISWLLLAPPWIPTSVVRAGLVGPKVRGMRQGRVLTRALQPDHGG